MKSRLAGVFNPKSGHAVMLAFDHGYIMGPTSGLERIDLTIKPLIEYSDCIMCTRGILRSLVPPECRKPISLRFSAGSTILTSLNEECIQDIEEAIRLDADCMAVQTFIGADGQLESIDNLSQVINAGMAYGIPTLGVVAVGKDMERTDRYFKLATRIVAEMGVQIVKTYNCEHFDEIVAACPVPIVVAGGKKLPEAEALTLAYDVIQNGAAGVDMGRNIFQSPHPVAMVQAVRKVVHEGFTDKEAYEFYQELIH